MLISLTTQDTNPYPLIFGAQLAAVMLWTAGIVGSILAVAVKSITPFATYGKTRVNIAFAWGTHKTWLLVLLNALKGWTVPKSFFGLFYVFGVFWNAAVAVAFAEFDGISPSLFLTLAFECHLMRRLYECIFVHRFGPKSRMPVHLWLAGMAHYAAAPFTILPVGHGQPLVVSYWQMTSLWTVLLGFIFCNLVQHSVHKQLAAMKLQPAACLKTCSSQHESGSCSCGAHEAAYQIPRGGLFESLIAPHYSAEVGIYLSLALAHAILHMNHWGSRSKLEDFIRLGPLLMLLWVFSNLTASAWHQREWYARAHPSEASSTRRRSLIIWRVL